LRVLFSIVFVLIAFLVAGQNLTVKLPAEYAAEDDQPKFIVKDEAGFIYLASETGLYFHDGLEAKLIPIKAPPSAVLFTREEIIVGTETGSLLTYQRHELRLLDEIQLADSSAISAIVQQGDTFIMGSKGEGLFILEKDKPPRKVAEILSDLFIYGIEKSGAHFLVGTDRGVDVLSTDLSHVETTLNTGISSHLAKTSSHLFVGGFGEGFKKFESFDSEGSSIYEGEIKKITSVDDRVFILTDDEVMAYRGNSHWERLTLHRGAIDMIYLNEEALLLLQKDGQLTFVDLQFSRKYQTAESDLLITALARSDSVIYVGVEGQVILLDLDGNPRYTYQLPASSTVVNFTEYEGFLYVGTFGQGVFKINLNTGEIKSIDESNGLRDNSILGLTTHKDTLWFSTLSGLGYISNEAVTYLDGASSLGSTYIYSLYSNGEELLVGTDGRGAFVRSGGTFKPLSLEPDLRTANVYKIAADNNGRVKFITQQLGAFVYENGDLRPLPGIAENNYKGYTAFGGGPGESTILIDAEKLRVVDGEKVMLYDEDSGFDSFTDAFLNTISAPSQSEVFFATGSSVYAFNPSSMFPTPQPKLISVEANFSPIDFEVGKIKYDQNNLVFRIGAPWYRDANGLEYRYRLKGLESEFRRSKNTELIYPNLPFGEYDLEVQVGYNGIFYGSPDNLFHFRVLKPFYLEIWFIALLIIGLTGLIFLVVKLRVAYVNRLNLAEKKLVESELAVLRNQINPHFLFNSFNTLLTIIEPDSQAGAEYLEKLSDFYRKILEDHKQQVIPLQKELKILDEYIYLQKKRFGDALELDLNVSEKAYHSSIPTLTLQLLAENALKHNVVTATNPLILKIYDEGSYLIIRNKKKAKRKPEKGTGTGLENIQSRYSVLFGKAVNVESSGDLFCVKLPLIYSDHHENSDS